MGIALLPGQSTEYGNEQILPDYAIVVVSWVAPGFDEHELEFPTALGIRYLGCTICSKVLWNKEDIELEMTTLLSQPLVAALSPPDDDGDDVDDDGGDDNDGNGPPCNSPPPHSSPPKGNLPPSGPNQGTSLQVAPGDATPPSSGSDQGLGLQVEPINATPPPSGVEQDTSHCPPLPRNTTNEKEPIPPNHTKTSWLASKLSDQHPYSTTFERYATGKHSQTIICY